jgi:myo-inositol-1(or 4)-monophosphatase
MAKISKDPSKASLHRIATEAAQAGGQALLRRFRTKLRIAEKPGEGIVTNADFESERAMLKVLKAAHPEFGFLTEESEPQAARSPGRFILDPLDGTANFAHGFPNFCISIAAEWDGEIVAGVIFHPVSGETYSAILGKGAYVNGRKMHVSSTKRLADAFLSTGFCSRKEEWLEKEVQIFERLSRLSNGVRRPGSAALDLAQVARGVFDGFWERGLKPWDVAAGALMVHEAGGKVTGFDGKTLRLDSGEFLASNGLLHRKLVPQLSSS